MGARIIALGQPAAGDDGAGPMVLARVRELGPPPGVELALARDAVALLDLLRTPARVVLVDAVLASPAGEVLELDPAALAEHGLASVSSHGISVGEALALARALDADALSPDIRVVAITIARPDCHSVALSPEVAAAVPRAADLAFALAVAAAA
ncbi:MAG: hydrogenase maturation protease [Polyangiaceae bacterium]|nr:hydrogenase maturation protease [Polyangiaceae bacterium]